MQRRDLPTSNPDRKKLWSFMTVHMTRRASNYFRHGVEAETGRHRKQIPFENATTFSSKT
jgi:hypothetical protein